MKDFFLGHLLIDLQLNKEAEEAYKIILKNGFQNSQYVLGQIAVCQHNSKGNHVKNSPSMLLIFTF